MSEYLIMVLTDISISPYYGESLSVTLSAIGRTGDVYETIPFFDIGNIDSSFFVNFLVCMYTDEPIDYCDDLFL